jgi:hypothetical protein
MPNTAARDRVGPRVTIGSRIPRGRRRAPSPIGAAPPPTTPGHRQPARQTTPDSAIFRRNGHTCSRISAIASSDNSSIPRTDDHRPAGGEHDAFVGAEQLRVLVPALVDLPGLGNNAHVESAAAVAALLAHHLAHSHTD